MKRVAVFAHYDKDAIIADYVLYYIKGLKTVVDTIIFVSDCDMDEIENRKLDGLVYQAITKRHGEYDFGSYKRGFIYALENKLLEDCDELILANDSCYAPLYPFTEMFSRMTAKKVDFWGATKNAFGLERQGCKLVSNDKEHIQSYFMGFRRQVFTDACFIEFMYGIKQEVDKVQIIIDYEIGLTQRLLGAGFGYSPYAREHSNPGLHVCLWRELFDERLPFIKTSVLRLNNIQDVNPVGWQQTIMKKSEYPIALINSDLARNKAKLKLGIKIKLEWRRLNGKLYKNKTMKIIHNRLMKQEYIYQRLGKRIGWRQKVAREILRVLKQLGVYGRRFHA